MLTVGFVLGTVLGMLRRNTASIRNLATARVETLMQAAMHLGLAFAMEQSNSTRRLRSYGPFGGAISE